MGRGDTIWYGKMLCFLLNYVCQNSLKSLSDRWKIIIYEWCTINLYNYLIAVYPHNAAGHKLLGINTTGCHLTFGEKDQKP